MTANSPWCIHHPEEFADVRRKLMCLGIDCGAPDLDFAEFSTEEKRREHIKPAIEEFQKNPANQESYRALKSATVGCCDVYTWDALKDASGILFSEAAQWELDRLDEAHAYDIQASPTSFTVPTPHAVRPAIESEVHQRAHRESLFGLALSGGGIRSATFNLGILQGLAEKDILRCVDFLSTVSGGSYIGSWLSAWIHRAGGNIANIADQLKTKNGKLEADPIKALRQYSNFLTPKVGLFGADTWTIIATWLRNMMLNFAIMISLIAIVMSIPRALAVGLSLLVAYPATHPNDPSRFFWINFIGLVGLLTYLWAVFFIALNITLRSSEKSNSLGLVTSRREAIIRNVLAFINTWLAKQSQKDVLQRVIIPLLISGFSLSVWLWVRRTDILPHIRYDDLGTVGLNLAKLFGATVFYLVIWGFGWGYATYQNKKNLASKTSKGFVAEIRGHVLFSVLAFLFGAFLIYLTLKTVNAIFDGSPGVQHVSHLVVWGIPVMLSIFGLVMVLLIGLLGRLYNDRSREWWSRMGGWLTVFVIGWTVVTGIALYSPPIFAWLHAKTAAWASSTLTLGWILTTAAGVLVGSSSLTGNETSSPSLERFVRIAPYVFILGLLIAISVSLQAILSPGQISSAVEYCSLENYMHYELGLLEGTNGYTLAISFFFLALVAFGLGRRVDINKFSLYMMYRNRLVRAYLGASRRLRNPHPFTGFDENDDVLLRDILAPVANKPIQRPYHIINAALNLVKGDELAWQERKAAAFAFTPAFCGYEMPRRPRNMSTPQTTAQARGCYRPTSDYQRPESIGDEESGVKVGQALTISGAAASPSMGYHSSPPLTFLMTLFNVRLGRWCANPRWDKWREPSPKSGLKPLVDELFGQTDADAEFLYLSDGGHFENLGIYELVRRRCKLIVAIDASEDEKSRFNDLGDSIRKCYTDFGVRVDIDINGLRSHDQDKLCKSHYAIGKIHYEEVDAYGVPGTLLYIKASLTGNEPADILNYAKRESSFPNQSTADQWFDESQFEAYRKLGHHIATSVFGEFVNEQNNETSKNRTATLIIALERKLTGVPQRISFKNRRSAPPK